MIKLALVGFTWVGLAMAAPSQTDSVPVKPRKALRALADRFASLGTMSASFVQSRRTILLDEPIQSSGKLYYRRKNEKAVFATEKPRTSLIYLDANSYLVYRPSEKQAEHFDLSDTEATRWILLAFNPKPEEIEKVFEIKGKPAANGATAVILVPREEKLKKSVAQLTLVISFESEPAQLRSLTYEDSEGDEVKFELTNIALDPKLDDSRFKPSIPDDVRVIRHKAKKK